MSAELRTLMDSMPVSAPRTDYWTAIIDGNALNKRTAATRKLTAQRLSELYTFDSTTPLFRVLRRFWHDDPDGRALIALLCGLARDPLLRATASPVLEMTIGEELSRQRMTDSVRSVVEDRLNDATLDKVVRNASSSWTQSGHLEGRARKFRRLVRPTPLSLAYAMMLGYLQGIRGGRLFETEWTRIFDASISELKQTAMESKRLGGLDLKMAGDVVEISFNTILTPQEIKDSRVTH